MSTQAGRHMYVHVPFCDGKCLYCAFYSELYTPERSDLYLDALAKELDLRAQAGMELVPETMYLGGGTSSVLDADQLRRLCALVRCRISDVRLREWTMESNPGTLSREKLHVVAEAGVNRISLGAQSFDDDTLACIGRRHTRRDIERSVDLVRASGIANLGLDLIACLPGMCDAAWQRTIEKAISLTPQHVSVYPLTIEDGSRLARLARLTDITVPDEEVQLRALSVAESLLGAEGFSRYEISNYARSGFECEHNVACWRGQDYIGFGPAASSRSGRQRWTNQPNIQRYVQALKAGRLPPREEETLDARTDATERMLFGFRLAEGVAVNRFGEGDRRLTESWQVKLRELERAGLVARQGARWTLSARGRNLADFVACELAVDPEEIPA